MKKYYIKVLESNESVGINGKDKTLSIKEFVDLLENESSVKIFKEFLTVKEVAELFRSSETAIRYYVKNGELPKPLVIGSKMLFDKEKMYNFIEERI